MNPTAAEVMALFRETGCPISECKEALAASANLDEARGILAQWRRGQPTESGAVPSRWNSNGGERKCPKCHHHFRAIPDVVTCPNCDYGFRSSSVEFPNYFELFVKHAPPNVADWFLGNQLQGVRKVFAQMATYGTNSEQHTFTLLAIEFGAEKEINLTQLLTTVSAPKLRAIGDLFAAMAAGYDAIDAWLETWEKTKYQRPQNRVRVPVTGHPPHTT